jgi:hypothetical protein
MIALNIQKGHFVASTQNIDDIDVIVLEKDQNTFELIRDLLNESKPSIKIHHITFIEQATPKLLSNKNLKYFFCGFEIGNSEEEYIESLAMSLVIKFRDDVKYIPYPYLDKEDLMFSKNKVLLINKIGVLDL